MYHWNGIIASRRIIANERNALSRRRTSAPSPSASPTDIGVPLACGAVLGRTKEKRPAANVTAAPPANIHGEESNVLNPAAAAASEKTQEAIQPSVPNMRMRGKASLLAWAIATVAVSAHVGM